MPAWFLLALAVPIDHVAATVDGHVIWESQVADRTRQSPTPRDHALAELVTDQLLVDEANRRAIQIDDALVDAALASVKTTNHLDDAALARALVAAGETLADYRDDLRVQLVAQTLITRTGEPRDQLAGELRAHARIAIAPVVALGPTAGLHGAIAAIAVAGGTPAQRTVARDATAALVGTALDRHRVRNALDAVMADQTLADATVTATQDGGGIDVAIALTSQPALVGIEVREVGGRKLQAAAALTGLLGKPLSPVLFDAERDRLRDDYIDQGYRHATATWRAVADGAGVAAVVEITPGDRVTFGEIHPHGNHDVADADLVHAIATGLPRGAPWRDGPVERAGLLLEQYYWDHGYAEVRVAIDAPAERGESPIGFAIQEGARFRIRAVRATGLGPTAAWYLAQLAVQPGAVFSRTAILDARARLASIASARLGRAVDVQIAEQLDAANAMVDLTFDVH